MAVIDITLPDRLREDVEKLAEEQGVAPSEFIIWALAELVGRLSRTPAPPKPNLQPSGRVRVTLISYQGIRIVIRDEEETYLKLFVSFSSYPLFLQATVAQCFAVENSFPGVLSWPQLQLNIPIQNLVNPPDLLSTPDVKDG